MRTGFYIVGILKGYKSSSFTNRETGEVKDRHNMLLGNPSPPGSAVPASLWGEPGLG